MANDKLPHERLREWADVCNNVETWPSIEMMQELAPEYSASSVDGEAVAFRRLADEIERYYIARPRYEDGEPVQFGDEPECLETVDEMSFYEGGSAAIGHDGNTFWVRPGERVKRPAPKVLDADGVPTEVGDAVYSEAGLRRYVAKVGTERCLGMEDWDGTPWVMFGNGSWMHAHDITHREPDSLRKLRDDMRGYADGGVSCIEDDMRMFSDRLTALMERGAE